MDTVKCQCYTVPGWVDLEAYWFHTTFVPCLVSLLPLTRVANINQLLLHIALQATPVCQQIVDYCRHNGWCEAVFQHGQGLGAQLAAAQLQVEQKDAEIALLKAHIAELEQQRGAGQA